MADRIITLDISDPRKKLDRLIKEHPQKVTQAMFTASEAVLIPAIKQKLRKSNTVFRGQLISRITTKAQTSKTIPSITFGAHGVKYGLIVEEGSKPRSVSSQELKKLVQFAKKKLGFRGKVPSRRVRRAAAGSRRGSGKLTRFSMSAGDVAEAIKRTIEKKGNIAHPYIIPTWEAKKKAYTADVIRRLRAALGSI